ncbi:hypothetical protein C5B42_01950 [Candidatus Cerribacteria bacterium 'Amazon FNV 2010 28 9']|uniref:Uncharacterized protein n=1 Tax=Candidatus Cerribacteria bacterium 'Amazon FNV 2010 28 9' TaxID=2081795 RepID=A0A317JPK8_9BACT|nr:MAG: hypothetical protein C5B42_01950 [Candidatus Cerribacteria bacterium 'Amazon FNV 2010 28 9']
MPKELIKRPELSTDPDVAQLQQTRFIVKRVEEILKRFGGNANNIVGSVAMFEEAYRNRKHANPNEPGRAVTGSMSIIPRPKE